MYLGKESNEKEIDRVIFSTRCDNYILGIRLASYIKKNNNIITVFAGPQATHTTLETMTVFKNIDYIIRGEGEITTSELYKTLSSGNLARLKDIDGLTYKNGGIPVSNKDRALMEGIYYIPDYDFVPDFFCGRNKKRHRLFELKLEEAVHLGAYIVLLIICGTEIIG